MRALYCYRRYYRYHTKQTNMPSKAKQPCKHQGCPKLVDSGYCDDHTIARPDYRKSAHARGYDHKWRRFRKLMIHAAIKHHIHCKHCGYAFTSTSEIEIDHIVPLHISPGLKYEHTNLQPLCRSCHAKKTHEDTTKYGPRQS